MTSPRVILVADDPAFSQAVQVQLGEHAGQIVFAGSYANLPELLTSDSDGLLLLAVTNAAELTAARMLVQQLVLQKWPVVVVFLDALGSASRLSNLDRHVSRRLRWPEDAGRLAVLVKELDRDRLFRFAAADTLED